MTRSFFSKYLKDSYWITPFICFILGYQFFAFFFYQSVIQTPIIVGKTLPEAAVLLSKNNLNMRMISQQEDPDIAAGTIISQTPQAHSAIKPQQTIFFVLSKKPVQPCIPNIRGTLFNDYSKKLKDLKIRYRTFEVQSDQPEGTCLAQIPAPNEEINSSGAIIYSASQKAEALLFPSCKGKTVTEVKQFLERYNIPITVYHTYETSQNHSCKRCIVFDQKPLAGSFVSLKEPFSVQLKV
ncbi:MAG: beta-lactam-binding protein with PASTA domain [Alteromonas naphthalenivorans]|jgi:beta-lactam-binding protein with PASTA domain